MDKVTTYLQYIQKYIQLYTTASTLPLPSILWETSLGSKLYY